MSNKLKYAHEMWAASTLLGCLGLDLEYVKHGDDKQEPDQIFQLNATQLLGIEVTTAYYDDADAKQTWTLARGEREFPKQGFEFRWGGTLINPTELMQRRMQKLLDAKLEKKYTGINECWLCMVEDAPLSDLRSVTKVSQRLSIRRKNNTFRRIYILHHAPAHEGGEYKAITVL